MKCSDVTNKRIARKIFLPFTLKHLKHVLIRLALQGFVFVKFNELFALLSLKHSIHAIFVIYWCQNIRINHSNHFNCSPRRDGSDERECTEVVLPGRFCPCPCRCRLSLSLVAQLLVQSCKYVPTVPTSWCYFFWLVLIFGKSTRKTANFWC